MFRSITRTASALALGLSVGLCAAPAVQAAPALHKPVTVRFATARPGSTWYAYAGSLRPALLKALPSGSSVNIMNTPMAIANTKLLAAGRADMGLSFPPVVTWARQGIGPFSKPIHNVRALVGGLDEYYQRITLQKDSKITSLAEIKQKHLAVHIGTGSPGSLNEYMARLILKAYGLSYADIKSYGGSVTRTSLSVLRNLFQDGRIDMIIGITTAGHPNTAQLATAPGEKFLGLNRHAIKFLEKYGFAPATMPAHLFEGQNKPIKGVGFSTSIYVNKKMPKAEAYALTKAIMTHRKSLKNSFKSMKDWTVAGSAMAKNRGVPLQAGAKAYFRQIGVLH